MKKKGSKCAFEEERNREILKTLGEIISTSNGYLKVHEIFRLVANAKASRFWVSEERATIIISKILQGDKLLHMSQRKREMFFEIARRVRQLCAKEPDMTLSDVVSIVVQQPAPSFYMTPGSVEVLICKLRKECQGKNLKLR